MAWNSEKMHHYTYFILPVYNFPTLYSAFRTDSGRNEHPFGSVAFATNHISTSFTQILNWKVSLVGFKDGGQRKLALTLHLLTEAPAEKLNHFFNLTSSLKHLPSGFSSRKSLRFGEDQFQNYQEPSQLWIWSIDDKKNLFEECDYDRVYLGNVAEFIPRNSGVFEIRMSMQVTVRDQPRVATYRPKSTPKHYEVHYVGETKHSDAYNLPFLLEFHTSDGIVKAHKKLVAAQSPYIKKMIENVSDEEVCKVHFPSVSTKGMKNFLMFIYFNKLGNDWKSVASEINEISTKLWCS
ncbi:unnamed protein product [Orchesella dallaii]|uniref:BTB domain-containing protein n=1 Tax=Orchesella dallaii TaxID=48710 RepID=A0ABP1R5G5_9HEXA